MIRPIIPLNDDSDCMHGSLERLIISRMTWTALLHYLTLRLTDELRGGGDDNPRSNRPEQRTALMARELARYKLHIVVISETRLSEQGQLEEVGVGYTFFWSGRHKAERRDAGVDLVIRNNIAGRLPCLTIV
ncbi:hypothetical protein SprV_0200819600 [Sparganum proliferum]